MHLMSTQRREVSPYRSTRGFTIIEQAVSLTIIALILGTIMVPLQTQIENRKVDETRRMLEVAQEMLLGFAAAHGYFPCPATDTSQGREPPGTDHTLGTCPAWSGYLPAALLGFRPTDANGFASDAWEGSSNRIRYAVTANAVGGVEYAFTRVNGLRRESGPSSRRSGRMRLRRQRTRRGRERSFRSTTPIWHWHSRG